MEDAAAQDVVGGLLRVAPAAAARLEAVVRLPAAPLHVAEVDGGAVAELVAQLGDGRREVAQMDERVVVRLAVVRVLGVGRGDRAPPRRRLLGGDADVGQVLAAVDDEEVGRRQARRLQQRVAQRRAVARAVVVRAADHEAHVDAGRAEVGIPLADAGAAAGAVAGGRGEHADEDLGRWWRRWHCVLTCKEHEQRVQRPFSCQNGV